MDRPTADRRPGRWLWSVAGIAAFALLWQIGHLVHGDLVLPSPAATLAALWRLLLGGRLLPAVAITAGNALGGFAAATALGLAAGALAGLLRPLEDMLRPISTILIGVPAIAWVVLALLWFGGGGLAATFTVAVTTAPIVFSAAAEGVRSLDGGLRMMARAFRVPIATLIADVYVPHMLSYLIPALASALGLAWKVAVMAELLAGAGGIGDGLATARAEVDTAATMAWVSAVVALLLIVEGLMLAPLRRRAELWRRDLPERRP